MFKNFSKNIVKIRIQMVYIKLELCSELFNKRNDFYSLKCNTLMGYNHYLVQGLRRLTIFQLNYFYIYK